MDGLPRGPAAPDPIDGVAELGHASAPARRNRGVATAVVRTLLNRGREAGLGTAIAHTLASESASTTVLRRCGFAQVTDIDDPEEGTVWRWELAEDGMTRRERLSR